MKQYLEVEPSPSDVIVAAYDREDTDPAPQPSVPGNVIVEADVIINGWPALATPTTVLKWLNGTRTPVETATLDDLKAAKNAEINAARLKANRTSFQYAGKAIACDELSMTDIQSANGAVALTGALPGGWPGAWKAMDNTYVMIPDVATWTAFYQAMVDTGTANFNHSQDLKAQLAAATTPEQVAAIVW